MTPSRGARRRRLVIASGFAIATMGALVILIGSGSSGYARAAAGKATAAQYQYGSGNPRPGTAAKLTSYRLPDGIWQPSAVALEPGVAASSKGNGAAWVGDANGALVRVDLRTGAQTLYRDDTWQLYDIQALALGHDGRVWFVAGGRLGALDPRTAEATLWDGVPWTRAFTVADNGQVWLPAFSDVGDALGSFDPKQGVLTRYDAPTVGGAYTVGAQNDGEVWWCSPWGGLGRLDTKTGASTSYASPLNWSTPACALSSDAVWVATDSGAFGRLDPRSGQMSLYYRDSYYNVGGLASCRGSIAFTEQSTDQLGLLDPSAATPNVVEMDQTHATAMTVTKTTLPASKLQLTRTELQGPVTTQLVDPHGDDGFRFFGVASTDWRWPIGAVAVAKDSELAFVDHGGIGLLELPPTSHCG